LAWKRRQALRPPRKLDRWELEIRCLLQPGFDRLLDIFSRCEIPQ